MRRLIICAAMLAALPVISFGADQGPTSQPSSDSGSDDQYLTRFTGDVDGLVGWRRMSNTGYWQPATHPMAYGVQADFGLAPYLVRGETSFQYASKQADFLNPNGSDSGVSFTGRVMDLTLGARIQPASGWFRPYLGAGMDIVYASKDGSPGDAGNSDRAVNLGIYSHVGLALVVARHVHLGAEYRLVRGVNANLQGIPGDVDSEQASAFVGYTW